MSPIHIYSPYTVFALCKQSMTFHKSDNAFCPTEDDRSRNRARWGWPC